MIKLEQLNIEGRRSGDGFVAHKERLTQALSKAQAERVALFDGDVTVGRKGFVAYLKALGGSNVVKVIPSNGSASGLRTTEKGLRVVCGANQGYIPDGAWLKEKSPFTFCQVKVSPNNTVMPNLGGIELAEALSRVIPFASKEDSRPILNCIYFKQKEGKLTLTATDGYRLGEVNLDFGEGEGEALINASELKGLTSALKRVKRVRLGFKDGGERLDSKSLVIDTEAISYKWNSEIGTYPDYEKLIPTEFVAQAHFDTREAFKAAQSLMAIWLDDSLKPQARTVVLTVGNGKVTIEATEERGKAEIPAETNGEATTGVAVGYLIQALKVCGGMVDLAIKSPRDPMLFTADGYRLLVMPVEIKAKAVAQAETVAKEAEAKAESQEVKAEAKPKGKRGRKAKAVAEAEEDIAEFEPVEV